MYIPENVISEISTRADIVDIISDYVPLKKKGQNFTGLCPFHHEKTPSFIVSPAKQIFHCFGCGKGGNVFQFMMERNKISFVEAVQELAAKTGVEIVYDDEKSSNQEYEILYEINTSAAKYFSNNLLNDPKGSFAREYFDKRGVSLSSMRQFGLGYSFPEREGLINHFTSINVNIDKAIELGLIGRSESRIYDRLAGRVIFPIFSPNGRIIGFGGRIMEKRDNIAKYINSPESIIYQKGKTLYGLSFAKDDIRQNDFTILVEGYLDVIMLHQNNIKNVVAVSGTALTDDQALLLSKYSKNIILFFDADEAGIKASMRSIEILLKRGFDIKAASLPKGEDPDSYVRNNGQEKFLEFVNEAQNFLEFQTKFYANKGSFKDPIKTALAIREIVKPLVFLDDELKRSLLIKSLSSKFNLREILIENELNKLLRNENAKISQTVPQENPIIKNAKQLKDPELSIDYLRTEREVLKLLYEGKEEVVALITANLTVKDFIFPMHKTLFNQIIEYLDDHGEVSVSEIISTYNNEDIKGYISEICLEKYFLSKKWEEMIRINSEDNTEIFALDLIKKIKIDQIKKIVQEKKRELKEAKTNEEQLEIAQHIMKLNTKILEIQRM